MYIIKNGKIVTEKKVLNGFNVFIKDQQIFDIYHSSETKYEHLKNIKVVDAKGGFVTPGFIDIHSDYIEHMAAPRPTSLMDFSLAIHEAERELLSHGITTMYHSLSLYKDSGVDLKPIRKIDNVKKFINLIDRSHSSKRLIHHRFHARYEIDNLKGIDNLNKFIEEGKVDLLSFMDHSPGQGQYRDIEKYKKMLKSYSKALSDDDADSIVKKNQAREKLSLDVLTKVAQLAKDNNIPLASHDDDTVSKLNIVKNYGATISEFPITLEVAKAAKELSLHTVAGAPNVLLGGSHSGNLSAIEAINKNLIDVLCSDYYPASLLHAVFKLHKDYGYDLADVLRLVTLNPAKAVKIDKEVGSIEKDKMADVLIINELEDGFPVITSAFVKGKLSMRTSYREE